MLTRRAKAYSSLGLVV